MRYILPFLLALTAANAIAAPACQKAACDYPFGEAGTLVVKRAAGAEVNAQYRLFLQKPGAAPAPVKLEQYDEEKGAPGKAAAGFSAYDYQIDAAHRALIVKERGSPSEYYESRYALEGGLFRLKRMTQTTYHAPCDDDDSPACDKETETVYEAGEQK